ncbi:MAG TPA: type IV pilus assembly protein PilM [Phycisphaerae bacterium]
MAGGQSVWGIDLGKCALKALKLRPGADGQLEVVAHDYIEHAKILTQPDADRDTLIANALEKFLSRNDISGDRVAISVPGQHTLARFSKLPPVDAKKVPDLVKYEAEQQIPFAIDEVVWDFQTFQEPETPELEVGIFAMKRGLIRDYLLHFEQAGIEPVLVQSAPLALYNAVFYDEMLGDDTTIILDIGAENTDLVMATKHHLWTRTIPLGGNNFTDALVKSFKLSFPKAENLKRTAATSKYARQIFQAMRPIFADLVQELQRSIGFYTSTHRDAKLGKIIGLGSAFKLPGLEKYLQQNLQLTLVRPESFKMLAPGAAASAPQFTEQLSSFGVAYGLCVQGLDLGPIGTSLLPTEIARQLVWSKKKPFFGAAAACLLLSAGVIWFRESGDNSALARNVGNPNPPPFNSVDQADDIVRNGAGTRPPREYGRIVLNAAEALKKFYNEAAGKGKDEEKRINTILGLLENRTLPLKVFEVIHECLPKPAELAGAKDAEEYMQLVKAGGEKFLRANREEIQVQSYTTLFYDELETVPIEDVSESGQPDVVQAPQGAKKGYMVLLRCRTPYAATKARESVKFIQQSFMQNLRTKGRQPGMGFYINRVVMDRKEQGGKSSSGSPSAAAPYEDPSGRGQAMGRGAMGGGRGGIPGGPSMGGGKGAPTGAPAVRGSGGPATPGVPSGPPVLGGDSGPTVALRNDPVTGEPMDQDWVYRVVVEVVMGDLPQAPAKEAVPAPPPGGPKPKR